MVFTLYPFVDKVKGWPIKDGNFQLIAAPVSHSRQV
jgi:hypothetical protein